MATHSTSPLDEFWSQFDLHVASFAIISDNAILPSEELTKTRPMHDSSMSDSSMSRWESSFSRLHDSASDWMDRSCLSPQKPTRRKSIDQKSMDDLDAGLASNNKSLPRKPKRKTSNQGTASTAKLQMITPTAA